MEPHRLLQKRTDHACRLNAIGWLYLPLLEHSAHGPYCTIHDAMSAYG
jgi:hypothetical protein